MQDHVNHKPTLFYIVALTHNAYAHAYTLANAAQQSEMDRWLIGLGSGINISVGIQLLKENVLESEEVWIVSQQLLKVHWLKLMASLKLHKLLSSCLYNWLYYWEHEQSIAAWVHNVKMNIKFKLIGLYS